MNMNNYFLWQSDKFRDYLQNISITRKRINIGSADDVEEEEDRYSIN